jgi:hypothetical protein
MDATGSAVDNSGLLADIVTRLAFANAILDQEPVEFSVRSPKGTRQLASLLVAPCVRYRKYCITLCGVASFSLSGSGDTIVDYHWACAFDDGRVSLASPARKADSLELDSRLLK